MRNFYRLAQIDVVPAMNALNQHADLWNQNQLRTQAEGTPHRELDDIWLRMNDLEKCRQAISESAFYDHRESINYPAWDCLPQVRHLVMTLMSAVEGQRLGRCFISRMKPGSQIYPHKDIGDDLSVHYDNEQYYSRYHIVLQGLPGSLFMCGGETVCMQTGEVWWFNGALEHSVINNSADDRIHIVVDIKC
jgi:hypothetical protein